MGRRVEEERDELRRRGEALGLEVEAVLADNPPKEQIPAKSGDNTSEGPQVTSSPNVFNKLEEVMNQGHTSMGTGVTSTGIEGGSREKVGGEVSAEAWTIAAQKLASAAVDMAASAKDSADYAQKLVDEVAQMRAEARAEREKSAKLTKRLETAAITIGCVAAGTGIALAVNGVIASRKAKSALPLPVHEVGTPARPTGPAAK